MLIPGMTETAQFIFMVSIVLVFTIIILLGIEEIGKVSTIFSVFIFLVFLAITVIGLSLIHILRREPFQSEKI